MSNSNKTSQPSASPVTDTDATLTETNTSPAPEVYRDPQDYYNEELLDEIRAMQPVNDEGRQFKGNTTGTRYMWAAARGDDSDSCKFTVSRFSKIKDLRSWVDADPENRSQISSKLARKIILNSMQRSGWRDSHPKWMWHGVYYAGLGEIFQEYQSVLPPDQREQDPQDDTTSSAPEQD